ncbi:hypothetical protein ACJX0J_024299, partial [Zea mays]
NVYSEEMNFQKEMTTIQNLLFAKNSRGALGQNLFFFTLMLDRLFSKQFLGRGNKLCLVASKNNLRSNAKTKILSIEYVNR